MDIPKEIHEKLARLPRSPGVYLYKDARGKVIYVGKAKNLSTRIHSYFQSSRNLDRKTRYLVARISDLDYVVLGSEMEALVAENNFIKEYRPRYNIRLKDDKSFPYIRITLEEELPRIFLTRKMEGEKSLYLGPYTSVGVIRNTLRILKTVFPIRDCRGDLPFNSMDRECLYYHIGRCLGPCTGKQSVAEYRAGVEKIRLHLTGKGTRLRKLLTEQMIQASENRNYELAAQIRDQLQAVDRLGHRQRTEVYGSKDRDALAMARDRTDTCGVVLRLREGKLQAAETFHFRCAEGESDGEVFQAFFQQYYHNVQTPPPEILVAEELMDRELLARWLTDSRGSIVQLRRPERGLGREVVALALENARMKLDEALATEGSRAGRVTPEIFELREVLGMTALPRIIEGIDISNTGDREVVASVVRFRDGTPLKSGYRKYRIKSVTGQNDVASIAEVVRRRFTRLLDEGGEGPDLLLIDGGPGQLAAAAGALAELGIEDQELISLAKREEAVYKSEAPEEPLILPHNSEALKLLQRVRDESHRFARDFHRRRRSKSSLESELDTIAGLGPARRALLLDHFTSVAGIRQASQEDIVALPGFGPALAMKIQKALSPGENGTGPGEVAE
jgi:excinuclease ABC subunit C